MKKVIATLTLAILPSFSAFADNVDTLCEGHAKQAAIRDYRSEVRGPIQGSDGMEYNARILDNTVANQAKYLVDVSENNEDGEWWVFNYIVDVEKTLSGRCRVLNANRIGILSYPNSN